MAFDAHKNFSYGIVSTAPSPATSGTSLVVQGGQGAGFPTPPFNATIWPAGVQPLASNAEIVRVTGLSTDTFTITRTQESTSARTVIVGDQIAAAITAQTLTDIESITTSSATLAANATPLTYLQAVPLGGDTYCNIHPAGPGIVGDVLGSSPYSSNDGAFSRIQITKTGHLRNISVYINVQSGNMKIGVYDTGNANGTHSTRTQLAISGAIDISAANGLWKQYDPNLAVTVGDTLDLIVSSDNTTASVAGVLSLAANASTFITGAMPPSGAGTASPKFSGRTASFYTSPPSTITEANMVALGRVPVFMWQITA